MPSDASADTAAMLAAATAARARADAATPGPWLIDDESPYEYEPDGDVPWQMVGPDDVMIFSCYNVAHEGGGIAPEPADAQFIAHARIDVPLLAGYVEALVLENERLRGMVQLREDALDLCQSGAVTHVSMTGPELRAALGWTVEP